MRNLRDKITFKMVDYFKSVLIDEKLRSTYEEVNISGVRVGYYFTPEICGKENVDFLIDYIDSKHINTNSTFYQTWYDITSKTRMELFLDQLLHYATTYGTDFTSKPYIPNENQKLSEDEFNTCKLYTVIYGISEDEYFERCMDLIKKPLALNSELIEDVIDYIYNYCTSSEMTLSNEDLKQVKNKEAKRKLRVLLNIKPDNGQEMFESLFYVLTNNTLVIKDRETKDLIHRNIKSHEDYILQLTDSDMKLLAEVFYRYKPLFLKMKTDKTKSVINKIRKYANKYHKPLKSKIFDNVLYNVMHSNLEGIKRLLYNETENLSNFKLISILQFLNSKILKINHNEQIQYDLYRIRNGKSFLKEDKTDYNNSYHTAIITIYLNIAKRLMERLESKKGVYKLPENLVLVCPTSEKNFIGEIPMGSHIDMKDEYNYIGIYWKNEWGTYDYDLSAVLDNGSKVGWNSSYDKESILYSGDMTTADPEATEILYSTERMMDFNIYVNRYNGKPGTKFNMFYGSEKLDGFHKNQMVDPETIVFKTEFYPDENSAMIGRVLNNVLYFVKFTNGNSRVSGNVEGLSNALNNKLQSYIPLKNMLDAIGFEEYNPEKHDKIDYDFSNPKKSELLDLFS